MGLIEVGVAEACCENLWMTCFRRAHDEHLFAQTPLLAVQGLKGVHRERARREREMVGGTRCLHLLSLVEHEVVQEDELLRGIGDPGFREHRVEPSR